MSGREVNELVVALRPEGVDETVDGMQQAQTEFEETADVAEQSSQELEDFAGRFTGALQVATTGLAVAAGGLLSTVPLVGSAFAGLGAIIQSIGLQIDRFLRERLGLSADFLFEFANKIAQAEGPMADFGAALATLAAGFALIVGPIVLVLSKLGLLSGVASFVGGAIGTLIGIIGGIPLTLAAVAIALIAFAAAWITNWGGIRDTTITILEAMFDYFTDSFANTVALAKLLGERVKIIFDDWTNEAHRMVVMAMNGIIESVESAINSVINTINTFSGLTGISFGAVSLGRMSMPNRSNTQQRLAQNQQAVNSRLRRQNAIQRRTSEDIRTALADVLPEEITTKLNIDGKQVAESTDRWRGTSVANRGR